MKSILTNIIIIGAILLAYYLDVFSWFTGAKARIISLIFVGIVFIAAFKVLGNPFKQDKENEDK